MAQNQSFLINSLLFNNRSDAPVKSGFEQVHSASGIRRVELAEIPVSDKPKLFLRALCPIADTNV